MSDKPKISSWGFSGYVRVPPPTRKAEPMSDNEKQLAEVTCKNTDRELWRETPDDYYAPSIHVTKRGGIGMNVGGRVVVLPIREWHKLATDGKAPNATHRAALVKARDLMCRYCQNPQATELFLSTQEPKYMHGFQRDGREFATDGITKRIAYCEAQPICAEIERLDKEQAND